MKGQYRQLEIKNITKWIENVFRRSWLTYRIDDLVTDFSKGLLIIHLVRALAQRTLPVLYPKPKTREECIGNIEMALQTFKEDGVDCPGIFASDIANGDHEIIIALCYMLKHYYAKNEITNISGTVRLGRCLTKTLDKLDLCKHEQQFEATPKEDDVSLQTNIAHFMPFEKEDIAVFEWVSNQIGIQIHDYNVFNDGHLLCKLINKVSFRKISEKVIANCSKSERIKLALRFAEHELGIGVRLDPNEVIKGRERKVLREYIFLLKKIKSKQDELMMIRFQRLDSYSRLVDSIGFPNKLLERRSAARPCSPLHEDLCRSISKSALCEKLNHGFLRKSYDTSVDELHLQSEMNYNAS